VPNKQLELGQDDQFLALKDAWAKSLELLAAVVNKPSFDSWIASIKPMGIEDDLVILGAKSKFAKDIIEQNHLEKIKDTLRNQLGIDIRVNIQIFEEETAALLQTTKHPAAKAQPRRADFEPMTLPLNSHYTFDSFVVGRTNRMASACSEAVADNPGRTYNPLFIYGGVGLGKTHLMHAIGQHVAERHPNMRAIYVSGEMFTNSYIAAVREHRTADFRRNLRAVDLWLVDDIQFVTGKERTEEEFFHTYNALYDMGKQVVLTSDRSPKELELDPRLLSRFEAGMLVDIKPPDLETRMAIVQRKAQWDNIELPDEIVLYISRLITCNIRQLEGALIKLHAHAALLKVPLTVSLAEEVLGTYYDDREQPTIDIDYIQKIIAKRFDVEIEALSGKSRSHNIVLPRQIAMYLCRELTDSSLPVVGRAFGGRDHSTVIHSCTTIENKLKADSEFAALIEDISRSIDDGRKRG
jgi:chromosomal replication initiator protein